MPTARACREHVTSTGTSRAALEQHSQTLLNKLDSEHPPGIDTEFIEKMDEHRSAYIGVDVLQSSQDAKAQKERMARDKLIEEINDERIELQYVIESEFPSSNPDNAAVRRQFDLPPTRPFNAIKRKSS
jgi:hypothetical protein